MIHKSIPFQLKAVAQDGGEFCGYAAVFNNIDRTGDIIVPGAFKETLPAFVADGVIVWQHNWAEPIGRPLEAYEDDRGLFIRAAISSTARGCDARTLLQDGVVRKLSIGFETLDSDPLTAANLDDYLAGAQVSDADRRRALLFGRALKCINLYEVSPVSVPANPQTSITAVKESGATQSDELLQQVEQLRHRRSIADMQVRRKWHGRPCP